MSVRYISADRAIQAAGAAFACVEDDMSTRTAAPRAERRSATVVAAALVVMLLLI